MMKNTLILWMAVWCSMSCGASYRLQTNTLFVNHYDSVGELGTLQIFFKEKDEQDKKFVLAQRIVHSGGNVPLIMDESYMLLDKSSLISRTASGAFERNPKGVFIVMGDCNPKMAYKFPCKSQEGISEDFYIKYIHHTGVTEKLLDMPECFVTLHSDSVQLDFDNSKGHNNRNEIFVRQTIIDPDQVRTMREYIKSGHIFVINVESPANIHNQPASYKVLEYKNNAYIHWDGWWPIQFLWKYVTELKGFDNPADVEPEKEIKLDLNKDWQQIAGYRRNKNIRDIFFIIAGLYATYYIFQDKIDEVLGK